MTTNTMPKAIPAGAVARLRRRDPALTTARLDIHPSTVRRHHQAEKAPTRGDNANTALVTTAPTQARLEAPAVGPPAGAPACARTRAPLGGWRSGQGRGRTAHLPIFRC